MLYWSILRLKKKIDVKGVSYMQVPLTSAHAVLWNNSVTNRLALSIDVNIKRRPGVCWMVYSARAVISAIMIPI